MPVIDLGSVVGPQGPQGATGATGAQGIQGNPGPNQVTDQTSTNLNGVLFGNQSRVTVKPVDSDPTANSTNLVSSGGTDKAIKGRVPVYGLGKNLLRNAYFVGGGTGRGVFPVNQRGITSAVQSSLAFVVDGWVINYGSGGADYSLASGYFEFGPHNSGSYATLEQTLDSSMTGKTLTASTLLSDGTLLYGTKTITGGDDYFYNAYPDGYNFRLYLTGGNVFVVRRTTASVKLVAVKLELGSEQTLCHNEGTAEAPVWVLNEVPDYEYELYRCMTSTADSSDTYANKTLATGEELAYVENGTTASRAYAVGEYFCWHGLLYKAKTAIGNGDTFTENTNCEQVTKGGLNDVNTTTLYDIPLNSGYSVVTGGSAKYGKTKNGLVTVSAFIQHGTTDISPYEPFTLPDGFRPRNSVTFLARNDNHGYLVMGCIDTSGIATFYSLANTFGSGATFNTGLAFRNVYFNVTFLA